MKKLLALIGLTLITLTLVSSAYAGWVRGHYRSNGTYVDPYYRTNPDGNPYNNKEYLGW